MTRVVVSTWRSASGFQLYKISDLCPSSSIPHHCCAGRVDDWMSRCWRMSKSCEGSRVLWENKSLVTKPASVKGDSTRESNDTTGSQRLWEARRCVWVLLGYPG